MYMYTHLECSVEVTWVSMHDEEYHSIRAVGVIIIDQSTHQVHHTIILREGPVRVCACVQCIKNIQLENVTGKSSRNNSMRYVQSTVYA